MSVQYLQVHIPPGPQSSLSTTFPTLPAWHVTDHCPVQFLDLSSYLSNVCDPEPFGKMVKGIRSPEAEISHLVQSMSPVEVAGLPEIGLKTKKKTIRKISWVIAVMQALLVPCSLACHRIHTKDSLLCLQQISIEFR